MNLISGIGVMAALCLIAVMIFKQISPLLAGPVAVIIVCLTSGLPLMDALTGTYLQGVANFFVSYFPIFLLGNMLGSIFEMSGAATKIGKLIAQLFGAGKIRNCMIACLLCAAVMSYGGINSFVIIFAVYPIALRLFKEADIPTFLLPGIVCGGMWTFAMTGPFTPQIPNILSMNNLGTTSYAGLIPGVVASVAMAVLIVVYMTYEAKKCQKMGVHFDENGKGTGEQEETEPENLPSGFAGLAPLALVIAGFNLTDWGIIIWLVIGIAAALFLQFPYLDRKEFLARMNKSATDAVLINMNTAVIVGFGSVTALTPFYGYLVESLSAAKTNPYVTAVLASNLCSCILGSSSGGMALMYTSLKDTFLASASNGYQLGFIHRLCALGGGCLDTMPWNGSIISVYAICKTTHKQSYRYNFVTCGLIPLACTVGIALPLCIIMS
ncbi:MAG: hypothetical protein PHN80_14330 [Hespellia sp.]|nr:hypothetical protein [Hespellia sp.]